MDADATGLEFSGVEDFFMEWNISFDTGDDGSTLRDRAGLVREDHRRRTSRGSDDKDMDDKDGVRQQHLRTVHIFAH